MAKPAIKPPAFVMRQLVSHLAAIWPFEKLYPNPGEAIARAEQIVAASNTGGTR